MNKYVGCSKKDIDNLIESVQEPRVSVERYQFERTTFVYQFSKGAKQLFSVFVYESENGDLIKMSIICGGGVSDFICAGDDGYRKACVLGQLAKKMYANRQLSNTNKQQHISQSVINVCYRFGLARVR